MNRTPGAGASAQRQYQLRRRAWRRRALRRWLYGLPFVLVAAGLLSWWTGRHVLRPAFGVAGWAALLLAYTVHVLRTPQHVTAWRSGAEGERAVARVLRRVTRRHGGAVLADRLMPGSRQANVDFFVIARNGAAAVVDAKNWQARGARVTVGADGTLLYGNQPQYKTVDGVRRQAQRTSAALARELGQHTDVAPVLAIRGAPVGRRGVLEVDGVLVVEARRLPSLLRSRRREALTTEQMHHVLEAAKRALPPA